MFCRRKMKNINSQFEKINASKFESISHEDINNLIKDLSLKDLKDAFNFVEKLEADEEINQEIAAIKQRQCKTDRCITWVMCHAKY